MERAVCSCVIYIGGNVRVLVLALNVGTTDRKSVAGPKLVLREREGGRSSTIRKADRQKESEKWTE